MITNFIKTFFNGIWDLFSIKWPGFQFTIGQVFLATLLAGVALTAVMKTVGVHVPSPGFMYKSNGGNNRNVKVNKERKGDKK